MLALIEHGFSHLVYTGRYLKVRHTPALERAMDCIEAAKIIRTYQEVNLRCNQRKALESMSLYYTVLFLRVIPENTYYHFPLFRKSRGPRDEIGDSLGIYYVLIYLLLSF